MIYYLIYFSILSLSFFLLGSKKEKFRAIDIYLFFLISIVIIYMAAVRKDVGYDFYSYQKIFKHVHNSSESILYLSQKYNTEVGFIFLCKISETFPMLIFIVACISIIPKMYFIYINSNNRLLCLAMYFSSIFITYDMGVMRQGIAIAIMFFSIKYIEQRNLKRFILSIIIATSFHISAVIFIPLYFLSNKRLTKKTYYVVALISLILSMFMNNSILSNLVNYLPQGLAASKFEYYTSFEDANLTLTLIKRIAFLILFVEYYYRKNMNEKKDVIFLNGYFLSIITTSILSPIPALGNRSTAGLYFLQIFIFSKMFDNIKSRFARLCLFVIVGLLFYISLRGPITDIYGFYLHYQTIFD